ncbi:hypothetical protein F5051DRAFT_397264 [Lentinula edodes]|nr:hypothetical protein F5051DRAFT_397264 [Lentinula edodes]
MKLSAVSFLVAGAGLLQANASPLRVAFVSHGASVIPQANSNNDSVAQIVSPTKLHDAKPWNNAENGARRGCAGSRSLLISNTLRQALGLPLIETESVHTHHEGGKLEGALHFVPFAFGGPVLEHDNQDDDEDRAHHKHHHHQKMQGEEEEEHVHRKHHHHQEIQTEEEGEEGHVHHKHRHHHDKFNPMEEREGEEGPIYRHRHHRHHFKTRTGRFPSRCSFIRRLHFSLMTLGPWEGRAVAFVLGCGLGVLLRMFWVLTVVAYRTVRGGNSNQESSYIALPNRYDPEEVFVPPPVYIVDEKAPLQEELNLSS